MQKTRAPLTIGIVCLILGIMVSVQFRANLRSPSYISPGKWSELTVQIDYLRKQNDALSKELTALRSKLSRPGNSSRVRTLQDELIKYSIASGAVPVQGKGVVVLLDDNPELPAPGVDPNDYLVHAWNLLDIVNELKNAGAEAISINGERLIATSEIRCVGSTVVVNMNRIGPPFEIRAIGDPEMMSSSLNMRGGYIEALKIMGIQVKLDKVDEIVLPAYKGAYKYQYAKPVRS